jgi:cytochrome c biogenesis protein CcmG/thiol:disulfide interchange protein DsbE
MRPALSPIPIAVILVLGALVGLLGYGLASNKPDTSLEEAAAKGEPEPAPEVDLPRLSGSGRQTLADYRGKVVVLNFWASWCAPCRAESPLLERWHRRISRGGAGTVLGVDTEDVDSDARAFVREYGLSYPMLRDGSGSTRERFGVLSLPETFVIDRRGRVTAVERGPVDDEFMREQVAPLVQGRS